MIFCMIRWWRNIFLLNQIILNLTLIITSFHLCLISNNDFELKVFNYMKHNEVLLNIKKNIIHTYYKMCRRTFHWFSKHFSLTLLFFFYYFIVFGRSYQPLRFRSSTLCPNSSTPIEHHSEYFQISSIFSLPRGKSNFLLRTVHA